MIIHLLPFLLVLSRYVLLAEEKIVLDILAVISDRFDDFFVVEDALRCDIVNDFLVTSLALLVFLGFLAVSDRKKYKGTDIIVVDQNEEEKRVWINTVKSTFDDSV